jgi:hypothetical protein
MKADELDHIRADVHAAILEAQHEDPTVTLEILWRLFDRVGCMADPSDDLLRPWQGNPQGMYYAAVVNGWAADLLRDVQLRAVGKVSYSETRNDFGPDTPEDHR